MTSPYINTKLATLVPLKADQMDNKIYLNLKKNLENSLLGRCYKNYGIITEIYMIDKYQNGRIEAENFLASAIFEVEFSCRLCSPLVSKDIICEVVVLAKMFITVRNGPMLFVIQNKDINDKVFKTDNKYNYIYKKGEETVQLKKEDHVIIKISQLKFNNGDEEIIGMGILLNVADESEVARYYDDIHKKDEQYVDIDVYKNIDLLYD